MSISIVFNQKDPEPWKRELSKRLPEETIEIYPEIKEPDQVNFILAWKAKKEAFLKFPNVKGIQSVGASVSHIIDAFDVPDHIQISRIVDPRLSQDIFEFVLGAVLHHLKNFSLYRENAKIRHWEPKPYGVIHESQITILGAGKIGLYVAQKLSDLGFNVFVYSTSHKNILEVKSISTKHSLKKELGNTDYLVNLLPLTNKTQKFIDKEILGSLKNGSYFINVGRGGCVHDWDLLDKLDGGHLSGAFLDVFHEEPLPDDHPFWKHPKVFVTPHVAGITNINTSIDQVVENFKRIKNGQKLLHLVSKTKQY